MLDLSLAALDSGEQFQLAQGYPQTYNRFGGVAETYRFNEVGAGC